MSILLLILYIYNFLDFWYKSHSLYCVPSCLKLLEIVLLGFSNFRTTTSEPQTTSKQLIFNKKHTSLSICDSNDEKLLLLTKYLPLTKKKNYTVLCLYIFYAVYMLIHYLLPYTLRALNTYNMWYVHANSTYFNI